MSDARKISKFHTMGYPQRIVLTDSSDAGSDSSTEVEVVEKATTELSKGKNVRIDPPEGAAATEYGKKLIREWYKENNLGTPRFYSEEKAAREKRATRAPLDDDRREYLLDLVRVYGTEPSQAPSEEDIRKRSFAEIYVDKEAYQALLVRRSRQRLRVREAEEIYKDKERIMEGLEKRCDEAREELKKLCEHAELERNAASQKHDSEMDKLLELYTFSEDNED